MSNSFRNLGISLALGMAIGVPIGAMADRTGTFAGRIVHVSAENIKVRSFAGQELSFLIVPRFRKIFHADGKTTAQLNDIRAGDRVKILYDQSALGARHADEIIDETAPLRPLKS